MSPSSHYSRSHSRSHSRTPSGAHDDDDDDDDDAPDPPSPSEHALLQPAPARRTELNISMFECGAQLGRGKFGRVYLARHTPTNYICALKMLDKAQITANSEEHLMRRELEIHQNLAHANIVRLLAWFHDDVRICLVLEYAPGGNLFDRMKKQKQKQKQPPGGYFPEPVAARYVAQMADALRYLHGKRVLHRDVKPENVLLGMHDEAKLADFGYSVHSASGLRRSLCGTLDYIAPEMAHMLLADLQTSDADADAEASSYGPGIDQWSLGVLAYELVVGSAPLESSSKQETRERIAAFDGSTSALRFPARVSAAARHFIFKLLHVDAGRRLSLDNVLVHPWIQAHCATSRIAGRGALACHM
ncbi:kinase-like protein [Pleomassaria siparia CBS 279.74]|uniref:Aurora kinase n=1 Tax=Pleomassaria siparia CBS 279.74 TaxID=1314801 RepID=A0A6G1JWH1_9PLEO|nr:kinase-like protein [Pleomassaria siparia CBS 279.74]